MPKILDEYYGEHEQYKKTDNPKILFDWISEEFEVSLDDKTIAIIYGGNRAAWADKIARLSEVISPYIKAIEKQNTDENFANDKI